MEEEERGVRGWGPLTPSYLFSAAPHATSMFPFFLHIASLPLRDVCVCTLSCEMWWPALIALALTDAAF